MTKELVKIMRYDDLTRAYQAYNVLMSVYEDTYGGPRGAMSNKEYFAIRDSRDNIRQEVLNRSIGVEYGNGQ